MNGKKAKKLRRMAEHLSVGIPAVAYEGGIPPVFRDISLPMEPLNIKKIVGGVPLRLVNECTRKIYKELKRIRRRNHESISRKK